MKGGGAQGAGGAAGRCAAPICFRQMLGASVKAWQECSAGVNDWPVGVVAFKDKNEERDIWDIYIYI